MWNGSRHVTISIDRPSGSCAMVHHIYQERAPQNHMFEICENVSPGVVDNDTLWTHVLEVKYNDSHNTGRQERIDWGR